MDPQPLRISLADSPIALREAAEKLRTRHQQFIGSKLSLDLTRGKPSAAQLDLSEPLLQALPGRDDSGVDLRNYGVLEGLPAARSLCAELLGLAAETAQQRVLVGGNSSLTLMYYSVLFANLFGLDATPWLADQQASGARSKVLCPCPGYDRHFAVCEQLGIDMVPVALTGSGPDMDRVEALVHDPAVKGIWCVPRFSNPTGEVYCEETVQRIAALPGIAAGNFLVFWDNAYAMHAFDDSAPALASIERAAEAAGTLGRIIQFGSTSKITFAGAGLGYMASAEQTIKAFAGHYAKTSIGPDKLNQQRHINFLRDAKTAQQHMAGHAAIIGPKFEAVLSQLQASLGECGMGSWSEPKGGYFVSFDSLPGLAGKIVALAAEAGVKLTPAGATFPLGQDPEDKNIRLAPSFPPLEEVQRAVEVFVICVQLASVEQALQS